LSESGGTQVDPQNLTIFIPCYGASPYLSKTLESIEQTFPPKVKVVIIDDGSPTSEVLEISKLHGNRYIYIRNNENTGIASTFNQAIKICDTEYISICGSDDFYGNNYYNCFTQIISDESMTDLIIFEVKEVDNLGNCKSSVRYAYKKVISGFLRRGMSIKTSLLFGNHLYFPSLVWRHSTLSKFSFNEEYRCSMDWLLLVQFVMANNAVSYQKNCSPSFYYRRHEENFSKVFFQGEFKEAILEDKAVFSWIKENKTIDLSFFQKILTAVQIPILIQYLVFSSNQCLYLMKRIRQRKVLGGQSD
jgi:glycosyltransferase involved in cell wall biosynthesis